MKLSIIIPVYNVERYLSECFDSVKSFSFDYELIIVNDGSTDTSLDIINGFASEFKGTLQIINKKNGGLSSARNAGMNVASGDYFCFLDSDDYLDAQKFEALVTETFNDGVEMACGDYRYLENSNFKKSETYKLRNKIQKRVSGIVCGLDYAEVYFDYKHNFINAEACFILFKSEFLRQHNLLFKEGIYHEDTLFTLQCFLYAKSAKYYNYDFYVYRMSDNSIMRTSDIEKVRKKLIDKQNIALELFNLKKNHNISKYFLDTIILDLLLFSSMQRKVKIRETEEVLRRCSKRTLKTKLRILVYRILSLSYAKCES